MPYVPIVSDVMNYFGGQQAANAEAPYLQQQLGLYQDLYDQAQGNPLQNAFGGMTANPQDLAAENMALAQMQQIAGGTGMTPADVAKLTQATNAVGQMAQGRQGLLSSQMAERGLSGSGLEYAGDLAANQGAVDALSKSGTQAAGDASERALQAMMNAGQFSGQMNAQDWAQRAQSAQAQNLINEFNRNQLTNASQAYGNALGSYGKFQAGQAMAPWNLANGVLGGGVDLGLMAMGMPGGAGAGQSTGLLSSGNYGGGGMGSTYGSNPYGYGSSSPSSYYSFGAGSSPGFRLNYGSAPTL